MTPSDLEATRKQVYSLMRRQGLGHDDAEDVTQQTMIRGWENMHQYRGGSFAGWLCRIAVNLRNDLYRKIKVSYLPLDEEICTALDPVDQYAIVDGDDFVEVMADKAGRHSSVHVAYALHVEGLSYEEAAERFGIPLGTVRSRSFRGREILRPIIEAELAVA